MAIPRHGFTNASYQKLDVRLKATPREEKMCDSWDQGNPTRFQHRNSLGRREIFWKHDLPKMEVRRAIG